MSPEATKTKELTELVDLILDGVSLAVDASKDGHIGLEDLPLLIKLVPDLGPAFENVGAVPAELAHLSADDASALVVHVMAKLAITDAHARKVIDSALKAAAAVYSLVTVIADPAAV